MGSSASKGKPTGRPAARQQKKPPTKKPSVKKATVIDPTPQYIDNTYYLGDDYDARDGFLNNQHYAKSDPFPQEPVEPELPREPATYDHQYRSAAFYQHAKPYRIHPQERPIRAPVRAPVHAPAQQPVPVPEQMPVHAPARVTKKELQNWEVDSIAMPYTYTPAQPNRKLEAKVGHVTDDVIAVHEEPELRSMSTQTEADDQPSMPYKNLWLEERRIRQKDQALPNHVEQTAEARPTRNKYPTPYPGAQSDYRSHSSVNPVHEKEYQTRYTSLSTNDDVRNQPRVNHTAVHSLIPSRNEVVMPLPPRFDANVRFYRNEIRFRPDGVFIDDIHKYWFSDYEKLENVHTYIQWLFPLPERSGTNPEAQPLKQNEIEEMVRDNRVIKRLLKSYMMMLDFFGIVLSSKEFGKLQRAQNYRSRFLDLNNSNHNHQRITRITKSIGLLGLQHYQLPFVMFLLNEVLVTRQLSNVRDSVIEHWIAAINDNRDREAAMTFYIDHVTHHDKKTTSRFSPIPFESKKSLPDEDNIESDDETIVFDTRRDYEDVDIDNTPKPDENIDNTPKPYRAKHEDLTDIPPISVGLSRESW